MKSCGDYRRDGKQHGKHERTQRGRLHLGKQRPGLQAGYEKNEAFKEVDQQIPEKNSLQPGGRRNEQRPIPAHKEAGRHRRQHARSAYVLRQPERDIRRHQGKRDLHARIARPTTQAEAEPTDANSIDDLADYDQREGSGGLADRE